MISGNLITVEVRLIEPGREKRSGAHAPIFQLLEFRYVNLYLFDIRRILKPPWLLAILKPTDQGGT